MKKIQYFLAGILLLSACKPQETTPPASTPTIAPATAPAASATPKADALWVSPAVPNQLRAAVQDSGFPLTEDQAQASVTLDAPAFGVEWIYALAAPFPTVDDDISSHDLMAIWKGESAAHGLIMAESTLRAFTAIWGEPASGAVRGVPSEELLGMAWNEMPSTWAIIPFEEIQPKWKIISVDGQSPLRKSFDQNVYVLKVPFGFSGDAPITLPESNRDPQKLATVILTGVTAIVRATAVTMEMKGVTYPGELIRDWMREADIAHISNEVPFDKDCPKPNPNYRNLILCSSPRYMDLLLDVGMDVVELTGDHFADRGTQAMFDTLDLYKQNNIPYYGGGINAEEARQPLLMEVNGNKIAFMGCNSKGPYPKATDKIPGAANCDYPFFVKQVQEVKAKGYMVIFTFQHQECYTYGPCFTHEAGFRAVADAGATVVSGSQAHFPHIMEFRGDSFIHYGLGNLFFDQMSYILPSGETIYDTRREFLDRHVFYDGKYLGVELLTAMLEDYARPRPMTNEERRSFLEDYFYFSGFTPKFEEPIPQPTPTLTPLAGG